LINLHYTPHLQQLLSLIKQTVTLTNRTALPLLFVFILDSPDKLTRRSFMKRYAKVLVLFYEYHLLQETELRYRQIL
jgi:hypothetical protein